MTGRTIPFHVAVKPPSRGSAPRVAQEDDHRDDQDDTDHDGVEDVGLGRFLTHGCRGPYANHPGIAITARADRGQRFMARSVEESAASRPQGCQGLRVY